ncbi:tetratricopeptide repeat protein [Deinococcus radiophilus]|uniref:tetratricopeptide repeat protein n=1 Tax=Deinococcus radiophilus TaxID=32062 RepID=UPI0036183CC7
MECRPAGQWLGANVDRHLGCHWREQHPAEHQRTGHQYRATGSRAPERHHGRPAGRPGRCLGPCCSERYRHPGRPAGIPAAHGRATHCTARRLHRSGTGGAGAARSAFEALISQNYRHPEAHFGLALALLAQGQTEAARFELGQLVQLAPNRFEGLQPRRAGRAGGGLYGCTWLL